MVVQALSPISTRARRLAVAAVVAIGVAVGAPAAALACEGGDANPNFVPKAQIKETTVCLLNEERTSRGIRPLKVNKYLGSAAKRHAKAMVARRFFAHGDFVGRIRAARYLSGHRYGWLVAENIAWGSLSYATPRSIVRAWMNSPGHRRNILNGSLHEIGFGVARGAPVGGMRDAATYVTDFGTRR